MKVAIVILSWNGLELLQKFLPSVVRYSDNAEIWVADNASTDGSVDYLKQYFPQVQIIVNKENYGFARGYNEALTHIDADVYALVNSDIEVTPDWLIPIKEAFATDQQLAIIQPKIKDQKRKDFFEYAGAAGGFIDKFGYPFCRGRIFDTIERDNGQYDDDIDIFWASGACMFIRSKVFKELGGFDPDFFAHQEEIDLCWRAFNKGHKTRYVAASVVYHVGGATLEQGHPRKTFLNFRNSLLMVAKNVPHHQLYKVLFVRLLLDGLAGIRFMFRGQFSHIGAIVQAHFSFYKMIGSNQLKRAANQKHDYFKVSSIVYFNYLARKTQYTSLF